MKYEFSAPGRLLQRRIQVLQIGAGGTGSHLASTTPALHTALLAHGHPGLHMTLMDGDTVSPSNVGRQRYLPCDVGYNKAIVTINRLNLGYGVNWRAVPEYCELENGVARVNLYDVDLLISCVDRADVRVALARAGAKQRARGLWLDFGNAAQDGQIVLGHLGPQEALPPGALRLPHVFDLYPSLTEVDDTQEPSCSMEQALRQQDLFINHILAVHGINLIWQLLHRESLRIHGFRIDTAQHRLRPMAIDTERWADRGYCPQVLPIPIRASEADEPTPAVELIEDDEDDQWAGEVPYHAMDMELPQDAAEL